MYTLTYKCKYIISFNVQRVDSAKSDTPVTVVTAAEMSIQPLKQQNFQLLHWCGSRDYRRGSKAWPCS